MTDITSVPRAVVSLSGGMDSATVLSEAIALHREVQTVGFFYGAKHNVKENAAAAQIAKHYNVPFRLIDLSGVLSGLNSALLASDTPVPRGHYQEENMRQTVVPGRNTLFIAILLGIAESGSLDEIYIGIHSGDHFIYPDCRTEYFVHMRESVRVASSGKVELRAPFLTGDKTTIIKRGVELETPYHLTSTCYVGGPLACGTCGSCQERLEAFEMNGIVDPIPYITRELISKK